MQNPSRRAFLGGKTPEPQPWDQFLLELKRQTQGTVQALELSSQQALLSVNKNTDVHHARQLCQTFGVKLYVGQGVEQSEDVSEPILWLDVSALNQLMPVNEERTQWFMQAGVTVAQLREVGFAIPAEVPVQMWLIHWLGRRHYQAYPLAQLEQSGVAHASLLMADGTLSSLGLFGVQNTKPLNTPTLRTLVPQLFQLANTSIAQDLVAVEHWPAKYRLDIFNAHNPALNLAHLLLGAEQDLGVLDWAVLDLRQWQPAPAWVDPDALAIEQQVNAQELDAAVKSLFDPEQLFAYAFM